MQLRLVLIGPATDANDDGLQDFDIPCDTLAAIQYLCSQFPLDRFEHKYEKPCRPVARMHLLTANLRVHAHRIPPLVLKHQLYTVVNERTAVDQELVKALHNTHPREIKILILPGLSW